MPANYVLLERIELNASAASVTFANIPQTGYTDLKVVMSVRNVGDFNTVGLVLNGVSTNQTARRVLGSGSAASSSTYTEVQDNPSSSTANTFSNGELYLPNYTSSTNKSISFDIVSENKATLAYATLEAWLWSSTAAVTSIGFTGLFGGSIAANSTFSLYGLAALGTTPAIAPKASGGNIIDFDGTYWIHTFLSSGTFTPQTSLSCDYLVVAGGGSGANAGTGGGGGGAGGLRSTVTATGGGGSLESALSLASGTAYTVTIGAGGAQPGGTVNGNNGSNSVFASITSTGGGGGAIDDTNGLAGGSGGGAGGVGNRTGGAGTTGQGYAGGNSLVGSGSNRPNGGGGGAGAVGVSGTTNNSGAGGAGVATVISGTSTTYAGGGGGGIGVLGTSAGLGGTGGGGRGNKVGGALAVAGTVNSGGGGGGIDTVNGGGGSSAGGSGIVIIRYLA